MLNEVYGRCKCKYLDQPNNQQIFHSQLFFFKLCMPLFYDCHRSGNVSDGCSSPCVCFCNKTAPRPLEDASADTTVLTLALKSASTRVELRRCFTSSNDVCFHPPQTHCLFLTRKYLSGLVLSTKLGVNLFN